jgi:hypothetical protein
MGTALGDNLLEFPGPGDYAPSEDRDPEVLQHARQVFTAILRTGA